MWAHWLTFLVTWHDFCGITKRLSGRMCFRDCEHGTFTVAWFVSELAGKCSRSRSLNDDSRLNACLRMSSPRHWTASVGKAPLQKLWGYWTASLISTIPKTALAWSYHDRISIYELNSSPRLTHRAKAIPKQCPDSDTALQPDGAVSLLAPLSLAPSAIRWRGWLWLHAQLLRQPIP